MMIDIGAYGMLPGLPLQTFREVTNKSQQSGASAAESAYRSASVLKTNFARVGPESLKAARTAWTNVARQIQEMGGTLATQNALAAERRSQFMGEQASQSTLDQVKPWLIGGGILLGTLTVVMLVKARG